MRFGPVLLLVFLCTTCLLTAGCTQVKSSLSQSPAQTSGEGALPFLVPQTTGGHPLAVAVTVQKSGRSIVITLQGGKDADKVQYFTVDVNGIEQSKKLGNKSGDTLTLDGHNTVNVIVTAHTMDGSSYVVLDTDVGGGRGTSQEPVLAQDGASFVQSGNSYAIGNANGEVVQLKNSLILAPNKEPVDFEKVTIKLSTDQGTETLSPASPLHTASPIPGSWSISNVEKDYGSSENLLEEYKIFTITVSPTHPISKNVRFSIIIQPTTGSAFIIDRTIPVYVENGENIIY